MVNQPMLPKSHTNFTDFTDFTDLTFHVPHGRSTRGRGSITDSIRSSSTLPSYITAFMPLGTIGRCFTTVLVNPVDGINMKHLVILFLTLVSLHSYAVEYSIDWHFFSKFTKTSYVMNVKIQLNNDIQIITYDVSPDFSYSRITTGVADQEADQEFRGQLDKMTLLTGERIVTGVRGAVAYQKNFLFLTPINLLDYMARVLNGHNEQVPLGLMVCFPYLPSAVFPGCTQTNADPPGITMEIAAHTDIVHLTVNVNQDEGLTPCNMYLQYQDNNYHILVSGQSLGPDQIMTIICLHQSAAEEQGTVSMDAYLDAGVHEINFQYANIPATVVEALTGVVYSPVDSNPVAGPGPESGSLPPVTTVAIFTALVKAICSLLFSAPFHKE